MEKKKTVHTPSHTSPSGNNYYADCYYYYHYNQLEVGGSITATDEVKIFLSLPLSLPPLSLSLTVPLSSGNQANVLNHVSQLQYIFFSLVFCLVFSNFSEAPSINQHYVTWAAYATECIQVHILFSFFHVFLSFFSLQVFETMVDTLRCGPHIYYNGWL